MGSAWLQFIEATYFTRRVEAAGRELLQAIQTDLLQNPERGDVIQGTGGARKGRIALPKSGRGKRGGYRYIYLYLRRRGRIHLIMLYAKSESSDLSFEQKKQIREMIGHLEEKEDKS